MLAQLHYERTLFRKVTIGMLDCGREGTFSEQTQHKDWLIECFYALKHNYQVNSAYKRRSKNMSFSGVYGRTCPASQSTLPFSLDIDMINETYDRQGSLIGNRARWYSYHWFGIRLVNRVVYGGIYRHCQTIHRVHASRLNQAKLTSLVLAVGSECSLEIVPSDEPKDEVDEQEASNKGAYNNCCDFSCAQGPRSIVIVVASWGSRRTTTILVAAIVWAVLCVNITISTHYFYKLYRIDVEKESRLGRWPHYVIRQAYLRLSNPNRNIRTEPNIIRKVCDNSRQSKTAIIRISCSMGSNWLPRRLEASMDSSECWSLVCSCIDVGADWSNGTWSQTNKPLWVSRQGISRCWHVSAKSTVEDRMLQYYSVIISRFLRLLHTSTFLNCTNLTAKNWSFRHRCSWTTGKSKICTYLSEAAGK